MWIAEVPCIFRFVLVWEIQRDFVGVFNKTIIPLALVGYEMIIANSALRASLAIYHLISNAPTWNRLVNVQCAKASRLLGYVRRNTRLVKSITVRRWAYLILVRSHLGYATQVWTPQSIDLIGKLECVQRSAIKYILDRCIKNAHKISLNLPD